MRRVLIPLLVLAIILSFPNASHINHSQIQDVDSHRPVSRAVTLSDAGASGNDSSTVQYMSRALSGYQLGIYNSYTDSSHTETIDLSSYQVSGWTLYAVDVNATNITATAERVSLNVNKNSDIIIENNTLTTDALYQSFYNLPHDGKLENYSITYNSPYYQPAQLGYAYLVVRSNYTSLSANETSFVSPFVQTLTDTIITHDVSADNAILNASTYYYTVIDGTAMTGLYFAGNWYFNKIFWRAEVSLNNPTGYHLWDDNTWYPYEGASQREADLNYTYTPWNKTSGTTMTYSSAESISLIGNSTSLTGTVWSFKSGTNITQISFQSNQSVEIDYNITLWYKKTGTATTNWNVQTAGTNVEWNATTSVTFPVLTGTLEQYLNYSVQADWTPSALYNDSTLIVGTHTNYSTTVHCTDMTNGMWTLSSTAPNYVGKIDLTGVTDGKVSILTDIDINATIEDGVSTPITGGSTNLTVLQGGSSIYSPVEIAASGGSANFIWDINSTTQGNSTHFIEVWWTNGVEAGYNVTEVFVYYPTTLVADEMAINAYTENNFTIGVDFDQNFPVRGLDGSLASVEYSFDGGANTSLNDQTGGRWTATVSTATMTSGTYNLTVYAEGFALENQSLTIVVDLTIETQALNWSWSPSNVITYLESTNLTVSYRDSIGTNIPDAWINVTFDSTTYNLTWDATSEVYWVQLNGTDFLTVPGTTIMTLDAWKVGYTSQYNDTIAITVNEESTEIGLIVDWNPIDRNITYIEQITINVTYTYNSNPISDTWDGVWVRATFSGGYPLVNLTYNGVSEKWVVTLNGSYYLGVTTVTIRASATGYNQVQDAQDLLVVEDIPALVNSWTDSSASTDYANNVTLQVTVRDSIGLFINDATLSVNVFGTDYPMSFVAAGVYEVTIPTNETRGIHIVTVTMVRVGYRTSTMLLDLTVTATTDIDVDYISSEYEQWNLTITVTYTDTFYSTPITGATVTVTIDGVEYALIYHDDDGVYNRSILLDFDPGTYSVNVVANAPFCNEALATRSLEILAKRAVYLSLTTEGDPSVEGQLLSIIATLRYNGTDIAVPNMNIHFIVTIFYVNGTVEVRDDPSQYDTTNTEGVASWGFEIPSGNIESITVEAEYPGNREKWATSLQYVVGIGSNPIMLILTFFFLTDIGRILVGSILILGIAVAAYNKKVKPKKRAARDSLDNQLKMFRDLETLRHFMAVYLDRGTCVFYHPFTDERIQPDLISGFIAAITSVYGEIKGDGVRGTLEEIQYHGLRLNSYSGEFTIGILILEGEMTPLLRERLQFFVELFENQYDKELTDWTGLIDCFDPEWVVSNLTSAYNYSWLHAHKFGPTQKVAKTDARILDYISAVRDDRGEFYIKNLVTPLAEMLSQTEAQVLDRLLYLQDNGMIVPVSIQTVLQRQGMGLANGEIGPDNITLPGEEEPKVEEPDTSVEESSSETEVEPEPVEESPPAEEVDLADEFVKDVESLMTAEPEVKKEEPDSIDDFVKDVESLLTKEKGKEENE